MPFHASCPEIKFQELPQILVFSIFSYKQEQVIVEFLLRYELELCGFTSYEVIKIAFQVAEKRLNIKHTFNVNGKIAGEDWFFAFLRRHPELTLRKPEHTLVARAQGLNKEAVDKFDDKLEKSIKDNNI